MQTYSTVTSSDQDTDIVFHPVDHQLSYLTFTTREIVTVINGFNPSKATGPDNIPVMPLQEMANVITPSLCHLLNKSIRFGKFPTEWKVANIVPVYKKNCKGHTEN